MGDHQVDLLREVWGDAPQQEQIQETNPEVAGVNLYILVDLDRGLSLEPIKKQLLYRPGGTHEYIPKSKNLCTYIGNMHILHGPGLGRNLGPGPLQAQAAAQGPAQARPGPCKMCMFPMHMYRFCIFAYIHV